jgi:energy-coupling factor transporter ATP-binding protein EcfA2
VTTILCPFDLHRFEAELPLPVGANCPGCDQQLPRLYLEKGLASPTDVVMAIGRSGNGKTTLLMSMLGTLITRPDHLSAKAAIGTYAAAARDDNGGGAIAWARNAYAAFLNRGELPDATSPMARPTPFYMLDCPPERERRNLFLFDVAGEVFSDVYMLAENASFAAQARVLWAVVSLDRAGLPEQQMETRHGGLGGNLWDMLDVYASAREEIRAQRELDRLPQALLVIFTKADVRGDCLPELDSYMKRTGLSSSEERQEISDLLRSWLRDETDGGVGAVSRAEELFDRVEYCAVSATGGRVIIDGNDILRTQMKPQPRLILDPLTWTWELTRWLDRQGRRRWFKGRGATTGRKRERR